MFTQENENLKPDVARFCYSEGVNFKYFMSSLKKNQKLKKDNPIRKWQTANPL